jgi:regulator of protease activity HflC (stomatin/prohibitin superfamily)
MKLPRLEVRRRLWALYKRHWFSATMLFLLGAIALVYFWHSIFITIRPGQAAVLWKRFRGGTVVTRAYGEGMHVIFPWDEMTIYDVRVQARSYDIDVLSNDGLQIVVQASIRYWPDLARLGLLHQRFGPSYADKIILPELSSAIREEFGQLRPDEMYRVKASAIEMEIGNAMTKEVTQELVSLEDVVILKITLPPSVRQAIEQKLEEEQKNLMYTYRLAKEKQEAERKRIEAEGIRDFQRTIEGGLTASFLTFKGIEATTDLARSSNTKVIVIGAGKTGLPLILNDAGAASGK